MGKKVGNMIIDYGQNDGSNEENDYANTHYLPVNPAYNLFFTGNTDIPNPNRWQPLEFGDL